MADQILKNMSKYVNSNSKADPESQEALLFLIEALFGSIAYLDPDVVLENAELASKNGMSDEDRRVPVEIADYLMKNIGLIWVGLVVDERMRIAFAEAVSIEMSLEGRDTAMIDSIRGQMKDTERAAYTKGCFIVDLSSYNDVFFDKLSKKILRSFNFVAKYDREVSALTEDLTDEDFMTLGFVYSNFMYLLRAFTKDELFFDYVKSIISSVKTSLKEQEG